MSDTAAWVVVRSDDLRDHDLIEFTGRGTCISDAPESWRILTDTGWLRPLFTAELDAMTIRRAPPTPEPVTLAEAMEQIRKSLGDSLISPALREILARYDRERAQ